MLRIIVVLLLTLDLIYTVFSYYYPLNSQKNFFLGNEVKNVVSSTAYNPIILERIAGMNKLVTNWGVIDNKYAGLILSLDRDARNVNSDLRIQIKGEGEVKMYYVLPKKDLEVTKISIVQNGVIKEGGLGDLKAGDWVEVYERLSLDKPLSEARELIEINVDKGK